jgi:hypothetical protein
MTMSLVAGQAFGCDCMNTKHKCDLDLAHQVCNTMIQVSKRQFKSPVQVFELMVEVESYSCNSSNVKLHLLHALCYSCNSSNVKLHLLHALCEEVFRVTQQVDSIQLKAHVHIR